MSFASTLDGFCNTVNCTGKELAALSGISAATLSRYRRGERVPEPGSAALTHLARGIAELSLREDSSTTLAEDEVFNALSAGVANARMIGMDFNMRLDTLMHALSISNVSMAMATRVDPSYISRIRKGLRKPAELAAFVDSAARLAADTCLRKDLLADLVELTGANGIGSFNPDRNIDDSSSLAETIENWLLGDDIVEADIFELEKLFTWLDTADLGDWLAIGGQKPEGAAEPEESPEHVARFYYGIDGMRNAELEFLGTALKTRTCKLALSSDMPLLQMQLDRTFLLRYRRGLEKLLKAGCHINIVHSVERPLEETIRALRMWIPFYMTGRVTPYYLKGIHNRLFYHVNYVCDSCALASEAMSGHQEDGRYFFTSRPADVAYYQKKMGFILERSSSLLDMYREDEPEQRKALERERQTWGPVGKGRPIGAQRYANLSVVSYPGHCTELSVPVSDTVMHFVIRHPKFNYAVAHMK